MKIVLKALRQLSCTHVPMVKHEHGEDGRTFSYMACYVCNKKMSNGVMTGERAYTQT